MIPNSSAPSPDNWAFSLADFKQLFEESDASERAQLEKLPSKFKPDEGIIEQPQKDE